MEESSKNIYVLSYAKKTGATQHLRSTEVTDEAKEAYKKNKVSFYRTYGSQYIHSATQGYYCFLLIAIKCSSESQARDRRKKLDASLTTEDGSGSASSGKSDSFSSLCREYGGSAQIHHNLTIPKELSNFNSLDIKEKLEIVNLVDTMDISKANFVFSSLKHYPDQEFPSVRDTTNRVQEIFINDYEFDKKGCEYQKYINDLQPYYDHQSNYEKSKDTDASYKYYTEKLKLFRKKLDNIENDLFVDFDAIEKELEKFENSNQGEKVISLIPKKLNIVKHRLKSSKSGKDAPEDALKKTADRDAVYKDEVRWCPKFTSADQRSEPCYGYVFFNKDRILPSRAQPDINTKWSVHTISKKEHHNDEDISLELRDWMMEKLTPWQFYHCSITCTTSSKPVISRSVVYPEES